jgi:hypothetical protein
MTVTREMILKADDLPRESVNVKAWGGVVFVKTMTAGERDALDAVNAEDREAKVKHLFSARLVAATVVDEAGALLFTEADVPALARKSARVMDRIVDVALKLNRMRESDAASAEKNS